MRRIEDVAKSGREAFVPRLLVGTHDFNRIVTLPWPNGLDVYQKAFELMDCEASDCPDDVRDHLESIYQAAIALEQCVGSTGIVCGPADEFIRQHEQLVLYVFRKLLSLQREEEAWSVLYGAENRWDRHSECTHLPEEAVCAAKNEPKGIQRVKARKTRAPRTERLRGALRWCPIHVRGP
jgi:hypothetical protein